LIVVFIFQPLGGLGKLPNARGCCWLVVVVAEVAAGFNVASSTSRDKKYFL